MIAIVYYLHDIPRYKRIQTKMNLCAHETVNILQSVSQNRVDKKITIDDIKYAMTFSFLTIFPGTTQYSDKGFGKPVCSYFLGYFPVILIYCVVGNLDGKTASVVWAKSACSYYYATDGRDISTVSSTSMASIVKYLKNADPSVLVHNMRDCPGVAVCPNILHRSCAVQVSVRSIIIIFPQSFLQFWS
jgi:hypothetical protein